MKLYDVIRKEQLESRGVRVSELETEEVVPEPTDRHVHVYHRPRGRFSWKKIVIIALALILLAGLYIVGARFSRARVTIVERRIPFVLDRSPLELVHDVEASNGRLSFQTMVVSTEVSREVYGSKVEPSITKASGKTVFFNEYSKNAITIKSGTTLTAPNGKRYITQSTAKVPGYTTSGTTKKVGTSEPVTVVAADTGSSYNSADGATFVVSGYSGASVSKQFYARAAAITGGDEGAKHTLSEEDKAAAIGTLQAQLTERLKRETRTQIPADLITFPDLQAISIDHDSIDLRGEGVKFPVKMNGSMVSYLISRDALESAIALRATSDRSYADISVPNISDIVVQPISAVPTNPNLTPETITVGLTGTGTLITKAPVETIKERLVGVSRKGFAGALEGIPEIDAARFKFLPFWAPFFPKEATNIEVILE